MPGVFEGEQSGACEMLVIGFQSFGQGLQRQTAVTRVGDRLWLDGAENRRTAGFVLVGMCLHADKHLVTSLAVHKQSNQIGLGAAGHEQSTVESQFRGETLFKDANGWVFAVNIIAHIRDHHRLAHRRRWLGNGIAAQIDRIHGGLMQSGVPGMVALQGEGGAALQQMGPVG